MTHDTIDSMTSSSPSMDPQISALLDRLRGWIRAYVWLQGLALALIVLGVAFWLSLGFDWSVEPPRAVRGFMLGVVAVTAAAVIYRFILRRAFVSFSDQNLALLIERSFPKFGDSLVTAVELSQSSSALPRNSQDMLAHTRRAAQVQSGQVELPKVFRWRPLIVQGGLAALLVVSIVGFALARADMFQTWRERAFLQSDALWPRFTQLDVAGFDRPVKVVRGSDLEIHVRATGVIPETVDFRYLSDDGGQGHESMTREGRADPNSGDGQQFVYTVKSIASSLRFDIRGGDNRIKNLRIQVVESPRLSDWALHGELPEYLHRPPLNPPVSGQVRLPRGTKVTVKALSNKPLLEVTLQRKEGDQLLPVATQSFAAGSNQRQIQFDLGTLMDDENLLFSLVDVDGIHSRDPIPLTLSATLDEPPKVSLHLRAIGTSITPDARLPLEGEIFDDYGVASGWFEYAVVDGKTGKRDQPSETPDKPTVQRQDFRGKFAGRQSEKFDRARDEAFDLRALKLPEGKTLAAGQRLLLQFKAADTYALEAQPNVAATEQLQLDIVSPDQLQTTLQARELALRRRFETIIDEATKTRDALANLNFKEGTAGKTPADEKPAPAAKPSDKTAARSTTQATAPGRGAEPEDALTRPDAKSTPEASDAAGAELSPRLRRQIGVSRALENCERTATETASLAGAFDDLVDEYVNNRMDADHPEVVVKLREQIAIPLHQIADVRLNSLQAQLRKLEASLADLAAAQTGKQQTVEQFDATLVEMRQVLGRMLEVEEYNKLVEQLREFVLSNGKLGDEIKQLQKQEARRKLEE